MNLGVSDWDSLKWQERKELIQFHIKCLEESNRKTKL